MKEENVKNTGLIDTVEALEAKLKEVKAMHKIYGNKILSKTEKLSFEKMRIAG